MFKLLKYLKPYKWMLILSLTLISIHAFGVMYLSSLMAELIKTGGDNKPEVIRLTIIMIAVAVISGAAMIISVRTSAYVGTRFSQALRANIIKKSQEYSLSDMETIGTASLITRTTNDVNIVQVNFLMILQMLLKAPIMAIFGLILAFRTNAKVATIMTGALLAFIAVTLVIGKIVLPLFSKIQVLYDRLTHTFRETITGTRVIRAFNKERYEVDRVNEAGTKFAELGIVINKKFALLMPFLMLMINLGILAILIYGGLNAKEYADLTNMTAMIEYLTIIMYNVLMAMFVILEIPRAQSSANRINEVLELEQSVKDGTIMEINRDTNTALEFNNVSFIYHDAELPTLKNISFSAKAGETIAIIGPTGSGKSTVSKLIARFFDATSGEILLNGIKLTDINQKVLREHVGYIPQKAFLFKGTIASNLRFGNENATYEDLEKAARIAQSHDFIMSKKDGYDDFVSQGGSNLSGGQKQRVAIARALVRKPDIYVFDDSFSALDFKTDTALRQALKENITDAILIVVAQRISTVKDADKIIVLNEGEMVGIGNHEELLKTCDTYLEIALSQMSKEELFGENHE